MEIAGGLNPASVANILKRVDELDLSDKDIYLIVAIHYITVGNCKPPTPRKL